MIARRLIVTGLVQGVGFRRWLMRESHGLGVSGWVRNRPDGAVEALLTGPETAVEALEQLCHEGPHWAEVTGVIAERAQPGTPPGFGWLPLG